MLYNINDICYITRQDKCYITRNDRCDITQHDRHMLYNTT